MTEPIEPIEPIKHTKPNIFARLTAARFDVNESGEIVKGEAGSFGKYLGQANFMPPVIRANLKHGICANFEWETEFCSLVLVNVDDPSDYITFRLPTVRAQIRGGQEIQSLGGTQSYLMRYLYIQAYALAAPDEVDTQPRQPLTLTKFSQNTNQNQGISDVPRGTVTSDPLTNLKEDLPPISIEDRFEQIKRINFSKGLDNYWNSLPQNVKSDSRIIEALAQRRGELVPPVKP